MARPVRSAAKKARMLIAQGFSSEVDGSEQVQLMSHEEEDDLDDALCNQPEKIGNDQEELPVSTASETGASPSGFKTYRDKDSGPTLVDFKPVRRCGPHLPERMISRGSEKFTKAVDFFRLFFTPMVIQMLCDNSNIYGWMHIIEKHTYGMHNDGGWQEITPDEMEKFIGLVIMMGIVVFPDIASYWSVTPPFSGCWARRFMTRNRFKAILGLIHVADPATEDKRDKLSKLQPLIMHMKETCKRLFQPRTHIGIDERMVRSKARSGKRQYMPQKPVRFGFKIWCACESRTGYTLDFNVYTGRRETPGQHGLAYDVVMHLMSDYMRQGYRLYIDNFYTSLPLVKALHDRGVLACGTILQTRRGFPKELCDKRWIKLASRGDMRYVRQDNVLLLQWMDSKPVQICSTMHSGDAYVMVRRNLKDPNGNFRPIMLRKPTSIHEYNQQMGAVDLSDQLIQPYNVLLKSQRWWKVLFYHMIDIAIVNSYILFREWRRLNPDNHGLHRPAGYSHLSFRVELLKQLGGITDDERVPECPSQNRPPFRSIYHTDHRPVTSEMRHNCKICYIIHGIEKKTKWYCQHSACNIHLCHTSERNCMSLWHTPDFDAQRSLVLDSCRHTER